MTNKIVVTSINNKKIVVTNENNKKVVVKGPTNKIIVRAAGARGPEGGNTYYKGLGIPNPASGNPGDVYLDLNTSLIYTKNMYGQWSDPEQTVARAAISYIHTQGQLNSTWYIEHNLGFYPAISVMDLGGNNIECDIEHDSENVVRLHFIQDGVNYPTQGYAYLS